MAQDLMESLLTKRDSWREMMKKTKNIVKWKDIPWETNRQGKMKWYLHPDLMDRASIAHLFFMQEIPSGSRSGKQKIQGGIVHHILEGKGYTILDGVKHEWEAGDVVALPFLDTGMVYQHFNSDPQKPVILVAAMPNFFDVFGVDMGSGFEQLEPCPEYAAQGKK